MKKKLLSLVLAGAMVASTSVSAFADSTISQTPSEATLPKDYTVTDTEADANISIQGKIANEQNVLPPSTISISVPTAASFTVDKSGNLIGSTIRITSQGSEEVEVLAYKFKDTTGAEQINVVDSDTLKSENSQGSPDRKKVSLSLRGNEKTVSLITETANDKNGIYKFNTTDEAVTDEDKKIGTVTSNSPLVLNLEGKAITTGTALTDAVSDNFTLTLKLRKKS